MRKIKFRQWLEEPDYRDIPSRMVEPRFQGEINKVFDLNGKQLRYQGTSYYMQFTGFYDKNGREVYEGDILFPNLVVEWNNELGSWVYDNGSSPTHLSSDWVKSSEIIGNIYENPELLEAEK